MLPTGMSCARERSQVPGNALETALYSLNLVIARQLVEGGADQTHAWLEEGGLDSSEIPELIRPRSD